VRVRLAGGMGSIIDTYLTPLRGSGIDAKATNEEMRRLVEASDAGLD
jgi:hypothetical protein